MTKPYLLWFLVLANIICYSQEPSHKTTKTSVIDNDKVDITADTLDYFNQELKRLAIFKGNVTVKRGDMVMTSQKMTCFFNSDSEIHLIIAEGDVVITQNESKATSEKVAYSPDEQKIILIKKPVVYMNDTTIHARRITIYQESGDINFDEPTMNTIVKDEQTK